MIRLTSQQVAELLAQPETGMGYQTVEVGLRDRLPPRRGVVLNAELLVSDTEARTFRSRRFESLLAEASRAEARAIRSLKVIAPSRRAAGFVAERPATADHTGPATDGEPATTKDEEVFARFTAYQNDRRITPGKGLRPGTYATTEEDAKNVKTGSDAVERYALPDPAPAIYNFRIDPLEGTVLQRGVVQPDFGHPGGGVEVLFDSGTDDGTVSGPKVLPP